MVEDRLIIEIMDCASENSNFIKLKELACSKSQQELKEGSESRLIDLPKVTDFFSENKCTRSLPLLSFVTRGRSLTEWNSIKNKYEECWGNLMRIK